MKTEWFETFFQGAAVDFWERAIPEAVTLEEAGFLEKALAIEPGQRVLDVPCGNGRIAIELARRGYRVTGIDLSDEFLGHARGRAPEIDWRRGDMRDLKLEPDEFDAAYCFGNSFGYLDYENAGRFFVAFARAVRGRIVIDTGVTAESILPTLLNKRWHRFGDLIVLSEARYAPRESRLDIDYTFMSGGSIDTRPTSSYVYTAAELVRMLNRAGFNVISLNGGLKGEPYGLGTPRLVLTAERAATSADAARGPSGSG